MKRLKAAVIGAGSTYTPELIEGFIARQDTLPFESFALMDIDGTRLETVGGLAKRQLQAGGFRGETVLTTDLHRALDGADFVFAQMRVGKMAARVQDEKIPLKYGLLGQETTGAGGFMKALRTVPAMLDVAEGMKRGAADGAWLINFSNPSGIIAEALLNLTDVRMIGLCNCPINMLKEITVTIGTDDYTYEYVGLNHLSWITSVIKRGDTENLVAALSGEAGATMKNVPKIEYDPSLLRAVPYIPSSYLSYYYAREEQVQKCREAGQTRGEICLELEEKLLAQFSDESLAIKPPELEKRGGALYSAAAVSAAESIANDKRELHVVAAKNNGAVPFMDVNDVVEVACELGRDGASPQPVTVYNDYIVGLMQSVKAYEKLTVRAAAGGDRDAALAALMAHPLIGDYAKAKPLLDEMLEVNREHLPRFFA
ncbi:MAG: 6-phospho-beta-glucosidase [Oscillospiraceae bacterium]|jgi:6-phospho-beta-glucosidase|nr:6-phospho-beta-glucosidase [Oscillospiraceae bacterium]